MAEIDNTAKDSSERGASKAPAEQNRMIMQAPLTEAQIQAAHIKEVAPLVGSIQIVDYDPIWPQLYEREAERVRAALGEHVRLLEHVGSTSVPGLAAKPKIDILLVVANAADESSYVPALEAAGYMLHIREPDWYEHRLLKGPDTDINLHVFSPGCPEIERIANSTSVPNERLHDRTGSICKTTLTPKRLW